MKMKIKYSGYNLSSPFYPNKWNSPWGPYRLIPHLTLLVVIIEIPQFPNIITCLTFQVTKQPNTPFSLTGWSNGKLACNINFSLHIWIVCSQIPFHLNLGIVLSHIRTSYIRPSNLNVPTYLLVVQYLPLGKYLCRF